ncbi:MAG: hypothetical protein AABX11_03940 [Nanoarchaeota archaeon]
MKENHKNRNRFWIGIIVIIAIAIIFVFILNNTSQNDLICNSPYIKVGNSCCLDQNSNSACDADEKTLEGKGAVYASLTNFYGELKWTNLLDITYSSAGLVPDKCPNGKNKGDIIMEFSLKNLEDDSFDYRCEIELTEGEDIGVYSPSSDVWILRKSEGYSLSGKVALEQSLRNQHTIKVCCAPYLDINQDQNICKYLILPSFC